MQIRKSRDTWSNRQIWLWSTKWRRAKANRVLPRKCTGHNKHPLPTTQEKTLYMDITRWSIPKSDWLYSLQANMEKIYTVSETRPRADCGSDHELLDKFRLKLRKGGKTTRPFRYNLNRVLYNYTVELTNRFKGWDQIGRVPEELRTGVCDIVQEEVIKTIPKKKKCKREKWLSEEALQLAEKRRDTKDRRKEKIYPSECRVPKNNKER